MDTTDRHNRDDTYTNPITNDRHDLDASSTYDIHNRDDTYPNTNTNPITNDWHDRDDNRYLPRRSKWAKRSSDGINDDNSRGKSSAIANDSDSNSSNVNSTIVVKYNNSNDNVESSDNEGKVNTEENVDTKGSFSSELISENDILPEYVGKPNRQKYETEVKTNANADHIYQGSML